MRKISLKVIACALLVCAGTAQAQCTVRPTPECATATAPPRFVDNGDGTIIDNCTNLMWEKKTTEAGLHDVNNTYLWSADQEDEKWVPNGTVFTKFLFGLNDLLIRCNADFSNCAQLSLGFAGHSDWRLPEYDELGGIVDDNSCVASNRFTGAPCIDPIFGPTQAKPYWTATNVGNLYGVAASIDFFDGRLVGGYKDSNHDHVRAVRCAK